VKPIIFILSLALVASVTALLARDGIGPVTSKGPPSVSFAKAITINSPAIYPFSIAAGDLNHDGFPDLGVMGQNPQNLLHALGKGNGHFGYWSNDGVVGRLPGNVLFADVDLDGNLDAVTTDGGAAQVAVAFGNGKGHFRGGVLLPTGVGFASTQAAVVDLNGDGIPDIVGTADTGTDPGQVFVILGKGNRKFQRAMNFASGGIYPGPIAVGDLNHDVIPDLVVANYGTEQNGDYGNVAVLLGKGNGTFASPVRYPIGKYKDPLWVVLGDFSGDGNLDVAVTTQNSNAVHVLMGRGDGTFSRPQSFFASSAGAGSIVAADFNGDGKLDLAVTSCNIPKPCHVPVLLGNGDGTFQAPKQFGVGVNPQQLVVADFNHDGKPDIATINGGDSTISILLNTTPFAPPHPPLK